MTGIKKLKETYTSLYGLEGCSDVEFERIEAVLDIKRPKDCKEVAGHL
ncbi:hypothetical protein [Pseudomonas agarici]|nr:hypothetical protein [Pseudomonas agarici]NWB91572.1 hypothetical protein [Pseudomonas agarici]NWC10936.1 hypothetical protein [Pseudomonas agarici]SEK89881.1 hypothetical protein SAMN05216604_10826 [Pseudomonas agarici]